MRYDETTISRPERVGLLVREEIGRLLADGVKDPRIGLVTVVNVSMSRDLRSAAVYVSVYGDEQTQQAALAGLSDASGYIRRELAHRITLRHIPKLTFKLDTTLEHAMKMETLFKQIAGEEAPPENAIEYAPVENPRDRTPIEEAPQPKPKTKRTRRTSKSGARRSRGYRRGRR